MNEPPAVSHQPSAKEANVIPAAAGIFGLLLYALTCAPGVLWQDSATFQYRVHEFELRSDLGLALAHPTYILAARAFALLPLGDFAFRVNLFSAVCGAASLAVAASLLWRLTRSRHAVVVGTLLLAVSHTFWRHAVIAEVYTLYAVMMLGELHCLALYRASRKSKWLTAAAFLNGLNIANHLLAVLHLPAYAVFLYSDRKNSPRPRLVWILPASVLGCSPYLALIIADIAQGVPLVDTVKSALFGEAYADSVLSTQMQSITRIGQYFAMNFPTPLIAVAPVGCWLAWRDRELRWFATTAGLVFVITFVFAARYDVPDDYVFYFPCYLLLPLFVALAVPRMACSNIRFGVAVSAALLPALAYEVGPGLLERFDVSPPSKRSLPYRDDYRYFLRPRQNGYTGTERFAREALEQAGPGGLLTGDSTIMNALGYVRDVMGIGQDVVLTQRADITLKKPAIEMQPDSIAPYVSRNRAFTCTDAPRYLSDWLKADYRFERDGILFRITPLETGIPINENEQP